MELLIPGLILVAFMVWASTRIKKNAAAAFDAETVETDEFSIRKPEGFLHVLNDKSGLAFRSYSKQFGKVGNREVRKATIEIEKHEDSDIDALRTEIELGSESTDSFETYLDGGEKAAWMFTKSIINGGEYSVIRKLVTRGSTVWEGRESVLSETEEDLVTEPALNSFQVK